MAKRLLYLAVSALALTACTSSDVVDDVATSSRNEIRFENVVDKHTRVTDLTNELLNYFNVFGFYTMPENAQHANEVFDNEVVTRNGAVWGYNPSNTRYWVPGATYYFYAYSCGSVADGLSEAYGKFSLDMSNAGEGMAAKDRVLTIKNYLCDKTHQHDLLFASNTGPSNTGIEVPKDGEMTRTEVGFQFQHILSKLTAQFSSTFPKEYSVEIKNVKIGNIRNQGDYNAKTGWENVKIKEGQPYVYLLNTGTADQPGPDAVITATNGKSVTTQSAYVIPADYSKVKEGETVKEVYIQFEIEVYFNDQYVDEDNKVVNVKDLVLKKTLTSQFTPNWLSGNAYLYTIELDGKAINMNQITFTVNDEVTDWVTKDKDGNDNTTVIDKDKIQ